MANPNKPQGLIPLGSVGSNAFNGQVNGGNLYAIANDASNTYAIGDVVKSATGTDPNGIPFVTKATNLTTGGDVPLGIIVGFRVADPGVSLQGVNLNLNNIFLPLNSGTRYVYVVDDPDITFAVQMDATAVTQANLHKNAPLTVTANDTTFLASSPVSSIVVTGASITTGTGYPVRLMGLIQRDDNQITSSTVVGAYCWVKAKWNIHEYFGSFAGI